MTRHAPSDPYVAALAMLARRELSTAQIEARLARKAFPPDAIGAVLRRLRREGAIDDHRTAVTYARRAAHVKMYGRRRAVRELEGMGIDRAQAAAAVDDVYGELDEHVILERALARRLHGPVDSPAVLRRLYQYLVRQGFEGHAAWTALRARSTPAAQTDPPAMSGADDMPE